MNELLCIPISMFNCCKIDSFQWIASGENSLLGIKTPELQLIVLSERVCVSHTKLSVKWALALCGCDVPGTFLELHKVGFLAFGAFNVARQCTKDWDNLSRPLICLIWIYVHLRPINFARQVKWRKIWQRLNTTHTRACALASFSRTHTSIRRIYV